jgi:hypothetical protein
MLLCGVPARMEDPKGGSGLVRSTIEGSCGIRGVFGAEMYRPLHFEHLSGSSEDESRRGRLGAPARRG